MEFEPTGDTWGISGPTFLVLFLLLVAVVVVASAVHRRILFRGGSGTDVERLGPQQIAYLNGRDKLAVYTAIGGLRAAGAIGTGPDRTLVQTGPLPSGVTPLDTAVYHAAGQGVRAREVGSHQWVRTAVQELHDGLERAGLVVTDGQRRIARLWAVAGAVLVVLGLARIVDGMQNDKPVGFLVALLVGAVLATVLILARSGATRTRTAAAGLRGLRRRNHHLTPQLSPSYATYGATGAAMGIALFGTASLYAMDPAFAAEAEIQRTATSDATSGYSSGTSGSGSSCGGSGGCGGGGCGGGCGG